MKEFYPMHGIITTVITPFRSGTKEIDWPSFRREIPGLHGRRRGRLPVPCMASEMTS